MHYIERNGLRILTSEYDCVLRNKETGQCGNKVYLSIFDSIDNYEEIEDPDLNKKLIQDITKIQADSAMQYDMIDITMLALDEIFMLIEPILMMIPFAISSEEDNEEVRKPMVELYVVMIQRGLKTIDQVPVKYREDVEALLNAVE